MTIRNKLLCLATASVVLIGGGAWAQGGGGGGSGAPSNNPPGAGTNNAGNPRPGGTVASGAGTQSTSKSAMKPKRAASGPMGSGSAAGAKAP